MLVYEYLNLLREDVADKIINNATRAREGNESLVNAILHEYVRDLPAVLISLFSWIDSPEGEEYWNRIYFEISRNENTQYKKNNQ